MHLSSHQSQLAPVLLPCMCAPGWYLYINLYERKIVPTHLQCSPAAQNPFILLVHSADLYWASHILCTGFPGGSYGKESACNARDPGSIPGSGRSPGEGNGNPLQYSCLENPMDGGFWGATIHWVAKSGTQLNNQHFHFNICQAYWVLEIQKWLRQRGSNWQFHEAR